MSSAEISMIIAGIGQTLLMVFSSTFFGYVFGLPLGVLLYVSDKDGIRPNSVLYRVLDFIVNIGRSIPFIGRMVESSLKEVDKGVIEAAQSMGASDLQIIWKVLLKEARPSLINGATICLGTIVGYSAMAGAIGGGGLGDIAIRYGYYRYEMDIMLVTVIIIVILVQLFQFVGNRLSKNLVMQFCQIY